jgi:hypothetical protein
MMPPSVVQSARSELTHQSSPQIVQSDSRNIDTVHDDATAGRLHLGAFQNLDRHRRTSNTYKTQETRGKGRFSAPLVAS